MSEALYDEEIAPILLTLAEKCQANGIPFLALVEYAPYKCSRTEFLPTTACISQRIATWAARADGNIDSLMIAVQRHARENGHSSAVLQILGIPTQPEAKP